MLRWAILGLLAFAAIPSWAAKRVSIAQLEQTLSAMARAHRTDAEMAIKIGTMAPAERMSTSTLDRLSKTYARNPQTLVALQLFAVRSLFFQFPSSELPSGSIPEPALQRKLLEKARNFARETLPRLPNLFATRTTYSFDNSPRQLKKNAWPVEAGLHLVNITKAEVNLRNEKENIAAGVISGSRRPKELTSWGEFGSALRMVLNDSAKGTITWSHWEQFSGGWLAVFDYSVPKSASHYEILMPAERVTHIEASNESLQVNAGVTGGFTVSGSDRKNRLARAKPAYKGSLWIDPTSGTILRITIIAKIQGHSNLDRVATLVDYRPVNIGDKTLVCPVRSFALSDAPGNVSTAMRGATTEWLNENLFTKYHLFATTTRIVGPTAGAVGARAASEEAHLKPGAFAGPAPEEPAASPIQKTKPSGASSAASPSALPSMDQLPAVASPTISSALPEQPAGVTPTPRPSSISASIKPESQPSTIPSPATRPLLADDSQKASGPEAGLTLHVNVNAVLVPVVVRDKNGQSIGDLHRQDFLVFDDGKSRPISGFLIEKYATPRKARLSAETPETGTQTMNSAQEMALPARFTVFLFDDLHLTADQTAYAQKAAIQTLDDALGGSGLAAVVTTSGKINSGLTGVRTTLIHAINAVRPDLIYRPDSAECPKLNYYQADLIVNKHDPTAIADAVQKFQTVCSPIRDRNIAGGMSASANEMTDSMNSDPLADAARRSVELSARLELQRAGQDLLTTYASVGEIVKKMGSLPGERSMILISPGFPPVDAEEREAESRLINLADQSGVTIDALDARGVSPAGLQAEDGANEVRNPVLAGLYRQRQMQSEQNSIWDLADGTGGIFFHDNNDLAAGFRELLKAPETLYLLEIPIDGVKRNGAWHQLSVKTDRPAAEVQARHGYFAPSRHAKRKADSDGGL
jgi:VWFA-related protein